MSPLPLLNSPLLLRPLRSPKTIAVILAWFLGAFGVHNFYLGDTTKGAIKLAITVVSCGTLAIVSAYWGMAEGIMILTGKTTTDAKGNPLEI
ncbi:MAG: TM2 domain-containing protein [Clostridia bacterium]|nr:TM2 domain-containing protein [Clostridia bacterium]